MKPLYIGFMLAIAILAAGFLVPALLPPSVSPATVQAQQEAELARRQLHAYDASLPLAAARADLAELKEADFEVLVERSKEGLDALQRESSQQIGRLKNADRQNDMPDPTLPAFSASASGVRSSVGGLEKSLADNQKLLAEATKNARAASQSDRNALGVEQVGGMVKLVEAGRLLAEARELRAQLTIEQSRMLTVSSRGAEVQSERDRHAGLDVAEIQGVLDGDISEISAALAEAQAEVDRLTAEVAEREQLLTDVRAQLESTRTERLNLEETGFTVGDDASFEAYRTKYMQLSEKLRELEQREQLLALGGIEGGRVVGDAVEGTVEGGAPVAGFNELQRSLALAEDKLTRYTRARQALEDQKSLVNTMGTEAGEWEAQYFARLVKLTEEANQIGATMADLAQQAFAKEDTALQSARAAATAFKNAKAAATRWGSDARSLQGERDPQRLNDRLKRIIADKAAAEVADSAEAQANTLVGRILTERALGLGAYLDTLTRSNELMPIPEFDPSELQASFTQARDEAVEVLNGAREAYERLAQSQSNTAWVHQASLATVYHLLWMIDEFNAAQHRSNLLDQLAQVIANRQQSPYLQQQVALHALLTGGAEPVPPPPPPSEDAEVEQDSTAQPADEAEEDTGGD